MNQAIVVTEVVANEGQTCSFQGQNETLGVGKRRAGGTWSLKLANGAEHLCAEFDEMRQLIRQLTPAGACFERRRILARRQPYNQLAA